jgi:Holliday junction resolvase RusA-like endonuclease
MSAVSKFVKLHLPDVDGPLLSGPLFAIVHYKLPLPKKTIGVRREMLDETPHTTPPDADNLEKFLNDSLNKILWADDAAISWLVRSKSYTKAATGSTTIFVAEIGTGKPNYAQMYEFMAEHLRLS